MNYDFALMTSVSRDLHAFLENPTEQKSIALLFVPPPDNESVCMCLIKRRYEGWLKTEYFDLYLQMGGYVLDAFVMRRVNTYLITARRKEWGIHTVLRLSIPHDFHNAQPLHGKRVGVDRLVIGTLRSNEINTSYYACVDSKLIQYINEQQLVENNEVGCIAAN